MVIHWRTQGLERTVMAIDLLYSEPHTTKILTHPVSTPAEVESFAAELLTRYHHAADILPGIELRRPDGQSLSIAIAPFGWALVSTDTEYDQHSTRNPAPVSEGSHDVRWEEPDAVPHDWLVPVPQAQLGVQRWIADGGLTDELTWSDRCL